MRYLFSLIACMLWGMFSGNAQIDLSIKDLEPTDDDSIYTVFETPSFRYVVEHVGADPLPAGEQLLIASVLNSDTLFNSAFTLSDSLFPGDTLQLESPPFAVSDTGQTRFCFDVSHPADTVETNNARCQSIQVNEVPASVARRDKRTVHWYVVPGSLIVQFDSGPQQVGYSLYSLAGCEVDSGSGGVNDLHISTSRMSPGYYILELRTDHTRTTTKVMVR